MTKMTKRNYFEALLNHFRNTNCECEGITAEQMQTFLEHELELLAKKNSATKSLTAAQQANVVLKEIILEHMEANRMYTITELLGELSQIESLAEQKLSSQRLTAVVGQMCNGEEPKVERIVEKRRSYFRKVEGV